MAHKDTKNDKKLARREEESREVTKGKNRKDDEEILKPQKGKSSTLTQGVIVLSL